MSRIPAYAFKDEDGYTLMYRDGTHEELPVASLRHLRQAMRALGFVVAKKRSASGYVITRRRRRRA